MHSLLERQIRKFLKKSSIPPKSIESFIHAIDRSYYNYEDQFNMLQRAMSISSQELFEASQKLKKEAEHQKKVIASLTDATQILQSITIKRPKGSNQNKELTGIELAKLIEQQALQISEIEKQQNILLKNLEKRNKELNEYANIVSHDLKSPLRNIDTLIHWIKEDTKGEIETPVKNNLELIQQNIQRMDDLINGVLEYSVIDNVSRTPETNVDINILTTEILSSLQLPENITITIPYTLPIIKSDPVKIQKIFQNLINNAIQAMNKDKGEIGIEYEEKLNFWEFRIKDNGVGIAKKYHDKIFQIFQTLDDQKKSTGIGLSIVKKVVEFYNGKIWMESQQGIGSVFYFTLKK